MSSAGSGATCAAKRSASSAATEPPSAYTRSAKSGDATGRPGKPLSRRSIQRARPHRHVSSQCNATACSSKSRGRRAALPVYAARHVPATALASASGSAPPNRCSSLTVCGSGASKYRWLAIVDSGRAAAAVATAGVLPAAPPPLMVALMGDAGPAATRPTSAHAMWCSRRRSRVSRPVASTARSHGEHTCKDHWAMCAWCRPGQVRTGSRNVAVGLIFGGARSPDLVGQRRQRGEPGVAQRLKLARQIAPHLARLDVHERAPTRTTRVNGGTRVRQ